MHKICIIFKLINTNEIPRWLIAIGFFLKEELCFGRLSIILSVVEGLHTGSILRPCSVLILNLSNGSIHPRLNRGFLESFNKKGISFDIPLGRILTLNRVILVLPQNVAILYQYTISLSIVYL